MIGLFITIGYLLVAFLASRPIYGHLRARSIRRATASTYSTLYFDTDYQTGGKTFRVDYWNSQDRTPVVTGAAVLALLWPLLFLVPVGVGAWRWMTGSSIRSGIEIEAEKRKMQAQIDRLEKELGIR